MLNIGDIYSITIVTATGVKQFFAGDGRIVQSTYETSDGFGICYKIFDRLNNVLNEIRCIENIEIEYYRGN